MDLLQSLFTLVLVLVVFLFFSGRFNFKPKRNKCTVPLAKGAWPIIGHLPIYLGHKPSHCILGPMADEHGPVFLTRFGSFPLVVVSCHKVAKEIFTVHDKALDRPPLLAAKLLGYNDAMMSFSPYGSYWRELRKIATFELFSNQRLDLLARVREAEVDLTVREIYSGWEKTGRPETGFLVDMKQKIRDLTANISLMTTVGKRCFGVCDDKEILKCRKLVIDFLKLFGVLAMWDLIPTLGFLDFNIRRHMKKTAKELDVVVEGWIQEHKQKKVSGRNKEDIQDFLDVLIDALDGSKTESDFSTDTTLKALCLNFILAGSETAIATITWAIAMLANNPEKLKKVQEEIDSKIGKNRIVKESDITDLVYLQAVVKETTRVHPPVPLVAFRTVMEDFTISQGNYHVPAGSLVILNAWKIHHDPSIWQDPNRFEPERFLTTHKDIDDGGKNFKLLQFGLGRRSCPAPNLGNRMVYYILARFLQAFEVANPSNHDIDMTETNGLTNVRVNPLEVLVTPRLDSKFY